MNIQQKSVENFSNFQIFSNIQKYESAINITELMNEQSSQQNPSTDKISSTSKHINGLRQLIKSYIVKIKIKVKKLSMQYMKAKKMNHQKISKQIVSKAIKMYQNSSNKIIDSFFIIAMNESYLKFQTQTQLKQKLDNLRIQVLRNLHQIIKKVQKGKLELDDQDQQQVNSHKRMKAKNCKMPANSTVILQKWLNENFCHPYPTDKQRQSLAKQTNMTLVQVNNWLINKRQKIIRKYLKKDSRFGQGLKDDQFNQSQYEQNNGQQQGEKQKEEQ